MKATPHRVRTKLCQDESDGQLLRPVARPVFWLALRAAPLGFGLSYVYLGAEPEFIFLPFGCGRLSGSSFPFSAVRIF